METQRTEKVFVTEKKTSIRRPKSKSRIKLNQKILTISFEKNAAINFYIEIKAKEKRRLGDVHKENQNLLIILKVIFW